MRYPEIREGIFLERPNRFIARVELEGNAETVHVKNTGRCRELLLPGARVLLSPGAGPKRKTAWDLVSVYKPGLGLVNIDSQAPNRVMAEWLATLDFDRIRPEYPYGASRLDFCLARGEDRFLLEVKGCTLEKEGVGYFPDAPTERGVRHLRELTAAVREGWRCAVAFVIPMEGITEVRPNMETHPAFGEALAEAQAAGVLVLPLPCRVRPEGLEIDPERIPENQYFRKGEGP